MFRNALLRSARSASIHVARKSSAIARPIVPSSFVTKAQFSPILLQAARCYSAAAGLAKQEVEGRIVDLLKNFDKVCFAKSPSIGTIANTSVFRSRIHQRYYYRNPVRCIASRCWSFLAYSKLTLLEWSWFRQFRYRGGCDGYWGGLLKILRYESRSWYGHRSFLLRSQIKMRMLFSVVILIP